MTSARFARPVRLAHLLATTSAGAVALAAAVLPGAARAQSFQAPGAVVSGNAAIVTGAGTTDVLVRTPQTVINWTPTDTGGAGALNFQTAGTTATFQGDPNFSITNFTVLNRILPVDAATGLPTSRAVAFNGTVNSTGGRFAGGNVWFYSPGGIVVGATGVFNVGGLVLTTNDIDTTGGLFGSKGEIRFGVTPPVANAYVQVNAGAQVNAGSYVAVVAPRIVQGGTVTTSGSTAYVAAEKATIAINSGLFDIQIETGTSDPNGIVHTGTTTGPATGVATPQRVYLVSLAKNDALTMLLSGTIGYTPASVASDEGGAVILSAGGTVGGGDAQPIASAPATIDNISIANADFMSPVTAHATGRADITASTGQNVRFENSAGFFTRNGIGVTAQGGSVSVAGDLTLGSTDGPAGGTVNVLANGAGGAVQVQGSLFLYASAFGIRRSAYDGFSSDAPLPDTDAFSAMAAPVQTIGQDGAGGTLNLTASTGGVISAGALYAYAQGQAGPGTDRNGRGIGGAVNLSATSGGAIVAPGLAVLDADSFGDGATAPLTGGDATGGSVTLAINGGSMAFEDLSVESDARAGSGTVANGNAIGGAVALSIANAPVNWNSFSAYALAIAQDFYATGVGGTATGSQNGISLDIGAGGSLTAGQYVTLDAGSISQAARGTSQPTIGGRLAIAVHDTGALTTGYLYASVQGRVANSVNPDLPDSGAPPRAIGGTLNVDANGGAISAGLIQFDASGVAGGGRLHGGLGTGGSVTLSARNGGLLTAPDGNATIDASGRGGYADDGTDGTGGSVLAYAEDGIIDIGQTLTLSANGIASPSLVDGGNGGAGIGGSAILEVRAGTANNARVTVGRLDVQSTGAGNTLFSTEEYSYGDGGAGTGGTSRLNLLGGTFTANDVSLSAQGGGGAAVYGYRGGNGTGGLAGVTLGGGSASVSSLSLDATGFGGTSLNFGPAQTPGTGGTGTGGTAVLTATAGSLTTDSLQLIAEGTGGMAGRVGGVDGSAGGAGTGGTATLALTAGSTATVTAPGLALLADGMGGGGGTVNYSFSSPSIATAAGNGGTGTGGLAQALLEGGTFNTIEVEARADGNGGAGGDSSADAVVAGRGASGTGGAAHISVGSGATLVAQDMSASASGTGGNGGKAQAVIGFDPDGFPILGQGGAAGGVAGGAAGGQSSIGFGVDPSFATLTVLATATGGIGGDGGIGSAGGSATGGTATLAHLAGPLIVTDTIRVSAAAVGGAGGAGFSGPGGAGGTATGGAAALNESGAGATIDVTTLAIDADAAGGVGGIGGGDGVSVTTGATGGGATGGSALLSIGVGSSLRFGNTATIGTNIVGGDGAAGTLGGAAGIGGAATGGSAAVRLDGGTLGYVAAQGGTGVLLVESMAQGGAGASSAGGAASISAVNGTLSVVEAQVVALAATGGRATFANNGSAITIGGNLTLAATGMSGNAGDGVTFSSTGSSVGVGGSAAFNGSAVNLLFSDAGSLNVAGLWQVVSAGLINADHLGQSATAPFDSAHAAAISWTAAGDITGNGQTRLRADGPITLGAGGGATFGSLLARTDITVLAAGNISGQSATATAGAIRWTSTSGSVTGASLASGGAIALVGPGGVTVADLVSGGDATLTAANGAVLVSHNIAAPGQIVASGRSVTLNSLGGLVVAGVTATAGALTINSGGALTLNAGSATGDAALTSTGVMSVATINAGGALGLSSGGGLTLGTGSAGGNATLRSTGAMAVTTLAANGALALTSGGTLGLQTGTAGTTATLTAVGNATIGSLTAAGAVSASSGGVAGFTGNTVGSTITVQSNDIAVGAQARLGQQGTTTQITLTSTNNGAPAVVGGPDPATGGAGYVLSAAEFARLFAGGISIAAPRVAGATPGLGGTADLIIRDLIVTAGGAGNLPTTGMLSFATPGSVRVEGALALRGFTIGGLAITSGDTLSIIAGAGSIDLGDGRGALSGHADLTAATIIAATAQAIGDVAASPAASQRSTRLGQNDGVLLDQGALRAGALFLDASNGVLIQNTGAGQAYADRRGFTANTIDIATAGPQTQIIINGQLQDAATGGFVRGLALLPRLTINGVAGGAQGRFDPQSTANGCLIANSASCADGPSNSNGPQAPLTEDQLNGKLDPAAGTTVTGGFDTFRLLTFQTFIRNGYPPLIDEPITGVGNEDLWNAACGTNGACAAAGNGQP